MSQERRSMCREVFFVICLSMACSLILMVTRARVGPRSEISAATVKAVLQIIAGRSPESADEAYLVFSRRFLQLGFGRVKIWQNQDQMHQWVFEATGPGMWGKITIAGVLDLGTETMLGMKVVDENETAGLGNRIADAVFCEQFAQLSLLPKIEMATARYRNNQFDAVSGATITSRALEALLNKAVAAVRQQAQKKK